MSDIEESFVDLIEENQWMEMSTKQRALKKLKAMEWLIDYKDWIMNDTELDSTYDLVNMNYK